MYGRQDHRKHIKSTLDYDTSRRRRSDRLIGLRKKRREEQLRKRRKENVGGKYDSDIIERLKHLPQLIIQIKSQDSKQQLLATTYIRQLLSMEKAPPIDEIIKANLIPLLVKFLQRSDIPLLQFEACWAITNITSGTEFHTQCVLKENAVPILIKLLSASSGQVREQAVWALGNIAGDSPKARNYVLKCKIVKPLVKIIEQQPPLSTLRVAVWCLSNLCRGKPLPDFNIICETIPLLSFLLHNSDIEVLTDACWAVSYISDGPNNRIQGVIENNFVKRLVELLDHHQASVQTPALRTIGNIVTGNDEQTQCVISCGALLVLRKLLNHSKKPIRKEAMWTISNINAGNVKQLQKVFDENIFPIVLNSIKTSDFDIKKEATWAMTNAVSTGNFEQVHMLVKMGCIEPMIDLISYDDNTIILLALDGLEQILRKGKVWEQEKKLPCNPYTILIEKSGGVIKIEKLQSHRNHEIYEKALRILERYFEIEEEEKVDDEYSFMKDIQKSQFYDF